MLNLSGIHAQFRRFGCAISVAYAAVMNIPIQMRPIYGELAEIISDYCGRFLSEDYRVLYGEFGFALGMPPSKVKAYLQEKLGS